MICLLKYTVMVQETFRTHLERWVEFSLDQKICFYPKISK